MASKAGRLSWKWMNIVARAVTTCIRCGRECIETFIINAKIIVLQRLTGLIYSDTENLPIGLSKKHVDCQPVHHPV